MTKVDCPVCGKTDLTDHLTQCPQCSADLECFRLLDALQEAQAAPGIDEEVVESLSRRVDDLGPVLHGVQDSMYQWQRAAGRHITVLVLVLASLGLVIAAGFGWLYVRADRPQELAEVVPSAALLAALTRARPQEKALREAVAKAVAGIDQVSQQVAALEQRVADLTAQAEAINSKAPAAAEPEQAPAFWYHEPRKNESLWLIAQKYYQQGALYPALLETNPGLGIYFDPDDGPFRLPPTRQAAEAIMARVVFTKDAKRFFRYPVQVADTWQSIAERFYGDAQGDDAAWLQALNADAQPQPGTRVVVPLRE
jgi:LysM repeat protein